MVCFLSNIKLSEENVSKRKFRMFKKRIKNLDIYVEFENSKGRVWNTIDRKEIIFKNKNEDIPILNTQKIEKLSKPSFSGSPSIPKNLPINKMDNSVEDKPEKSIENKTEPITTNVTEISSEKPDTQVNNLSYKNLKVQITPVFTPFNELDSIIKEALSQPPRTFLDSGKKDIDPELLNIVKRVLIASNLKIEKPKELINNDSNRSIDDIQKLELLNSNSMLNSNSDDINNESAKYDFKIKQKQIAEPHYPIIDETGTGIALTKNELRSQIKDLLKATADNQNDKIEPEKPNNLRELENQLKKSLEKIKLNKVN